MIMFPGDSPQHRRTDRLSPKQGRRIGFGAISELKPGAGEASLDTEACPIPSKESLDDSGAGAGMVPEALRLAAAR